MLKAEGTERKWKTVMMGIKGRKTADRVYKITDNSKAFCYKREK